MAGHVLDHFFFGSPTRSEKVKWVWFAIWAGSLIVSFFWFKDLAFGLYGPITDIKGYQWRSSWNVSEMLLGQADFSDLPLEEDCRCEKATRKRARMKYFA